MAIFDKDGDKDDALTSHALKSKTEPEYAKVKSSSELEVENDKKLRSAIKKLKFSKSGKKVSSKTLKAPDRKVVQAVAYDDAIAISRSELQEELR